MNKLLIDARKPNRKYNLAKWLQNKIRCDLRVVEMFEIKAIADAIPANVRTFQHRRLAEKKR